MSSNADPAPAQGLIIALSGIDSSGKSTQREQLADVLRARGAEPVFIWTRPGYGRRTRVLKRMYRRLRRQAATKPSAASATARSERSSTRKNRYPRRAENLPNPVVRRLWLTMALADLLWVYVVQVRWLRARGRAVICDRYLTDALVDFRVYFPDDAVEQRLLGRLLRRLAARPDVAVCLLVPAEVSQKRSQLRERKHQDELDVLKVRIGHYRQVCAELGTTVVDGTLPPERLSKEIRTLLAA